MLCQNQAEKSPPIAAFWSKYQLLKQTHCDLNLNKSRKAGKTGKNFWNGPDVKKMLNKKFTMLMGTGHVCLIQPRDNILILSHQNPASIFFIAVRHLLPQSVFNTSVCHGPWTLLVDKYTYCIPNLYTTLVHQVKVPSTQDKHHVSRVTLLLLLPYKRPCHY